MRITDAGAELVRRLESAGLAPTALEPWEAWKVFKTYLQVEVEDDVNDAASFQCSTYEPAEGTTFSAYFIRQFSRSEDENDAGIRRVVIEFAYEAKALSPTEIIEFWTHDFPTLSEFASVVEAQPHFQALLNTRPLRTEVWSEEI